MLCGHSGAHCKDTSCTVCSFIMTPWEGDPMADITVTFVHPTDGRQVTVTLDNTMTAEEAIQQLLDNKFVNPHPGGYNLAVKGGAQLRNDQTFGDAGVKDKD